MRERTQLESAIAATRKLERELDDAITLSELADEEGDEGTVEEVRRMIADLLARAWGPGSATLMSLMVIVASLTSINATMLVGARSNYALGRDWKLFGWLGGWHASGVPRPALLAQSAISLLLVGFGAATRKGFETMVDFTAPVFWFFFLLTGIALMVLRRTEAAAERPFRVPFYPLLPLLFCASAAWLLYSSLAYTGVGALAGVGVLAAGGLVLVWSMRREKRAAA